jgi:hypothetical protein
MVDEMPVRPDPSGTGAVPVAHPIRTRQAEDSKYIAALRPLPSWVLGTGAPLTLAP